MVFLPAQLFFESHFLLFGYWLAYAYILAGSEVVPEVVDGNSVVDDHVDLGQSESCCNCSVGEDVFSHVPGGYLIIILIGDETTHVSIGWS